MPDGSSVAHNQTLHDVQITYPTGPSLAMTQIFLTWPDYQI